MILFKEYQISGALERACEDVDLAVQETPMPSFDGFPKTKHAALESLLNQDREQTSYAMVNSVLSSSKTLVDVLSDLSEVSSEELAEFLAEKLKYAAAEDRRIVAAILNDVLR